MSPQARLIPDLPKAAWKVLAGDAFSAIGSGMTMPFLLVYLHEVRGIRVEVAAAALSMIAVASFAGNPLGGWLSDRIGSRHTLMMGVAVSAAGAIAVTMVRDPWHAFAAAATVGLGASTSWPAQDALLATLVRPSQRSSVFSVRHATVNAGFGGGGLLAALIVGDATEGRFVTLYVVDALTFLAFIPILLGMRDVGRRPEPSHDQGEAPGFREIFRDRVFVRVWILTALLVAVGYGQLHSSFPAYATGEGGISPSALAVAFAANTITVVAAQFFVLRKARGARRTRAIVLLSAFWAAAWLITLGAGALPVGMAIAGFVLAEITFGFGETLLSPTVPAMVNDLATDRLRGRYNGVATLAWTTGFTVGPLLGGLAIGAGRPDVLFLGLVVACGLAAFLALRLERSLPRAANLIGSEDEPADISPAKAEFVPVRDSDD